MTLAAVDDLDDAFAATRQFLVPVDAGRWLRLAVIAFFVGGAGGDGGAGGGGADGGGADGLDGALQSFIGGGSLPTLPASDALLAAVVALVALLLVVALAFAIVGAVMEFVLVESLRREAVNLRRDSRRYWRGGLRLFGFRLAVGLLAVVAVLALIGGLLLAVGVPGGGVSPVTFLAGLVVVLPVLLVVAVGAAVVLGLTTDFVVPVMLLESTTVLDGWRRFWPTLRAAWQEFAVYVLVTFVLRLVVGTAVAIVVGFVALVVLAPLGVVAVAGVLVTGGSLGAVAWLGLGLLVLVAAVVVAAVAAVVRVPVVTFFRYYALLVLGDVEADFDVVAERRAAIRAEEVGS